MELDIEGAAYEAVDQISKLCDIPSSGILAGGALGSLIWDKFSGNKSIINDIDIFHITQTVGNFSNYFYPNDEKLDYRHINSTLTSDYYLIVSTNKEGLLNNVYYNTKNNSIEMIIKSFDINCTQIGYDIATKKFFWTKEFAEFIESGNLKVSNLSTPAHTSIRLLKKQDELNAKLDYDELIICRDCLSSSLYGITTACFGNKYYLLYEKYKNILEKYLIINEINEKDDINSNFLYSLKSIGSVSYNIKDNNINNCNDFLFFKRNIERSDELSYHIWLNLGPIYSYDSYIDCIPNNEDITYIKKLIEVFPKSTSNLKGLSLSKQIKLVNNIKNIFDAKIALALLDNKKLSPDIIIDEGLKLILELSVRKYSNEEKYMKLYFN